MLIHIFALRWKPGTPQALKDQALSAIRAFPAKIPGIGALHAGQNTSDRSQGYETIGVLHFADQASLQVYLTHPVHQAFVDLVQPHIEAVDLDLEV